MSLFAIKSCIEFSKMTTSENEIIAMHLTFYEFVYLCIWMVLPIPTNFIHGFRLENSCASVPSHHQNRVHIKHSQNGIITQANRGRAFNFSTCIFDTSNISILYTKHIDSAKQNLFLHHIHIGPNGLTILMWCICELSDFGANVVVSIELLR